MENYQKIEKIGEGKNAVLSALQGNSGLGSTGDSFGLLNAFTYNAKTGTC
jgi:hypothetical protein